MQDTTHTLKWTKNAKDDLVNIITRIKEDDSPNNAKKIYKKLRDKAQSSHFFPLKGRVVPELQVEGIVHYREIIVSPWRIIYKVSNDTVFIMSIIDSRQNLDDILLQKILSQ